MLYACWQARWFQGPDALGDIQRMMLRAMPIFEEARPATMDDDPASFLDLLEVRQLAPPGTRLDILPGSSFVRAHSPAEARMMVEHLGVLQLNRSQMLQQHVFTR